MFFLIKIHYFNLRKADNISKGSARAVIKPIVVL